MCVCVCVCVRERERERESYVCDWLLSHVYVLCERERERERERESAIEREEADRISNIESLRLAFCSPGLYLSLVLGRHRSLHANDKPLKNAVPADAKGAVMVLVQGKAIFLFKIHPFHKEPGVAQKKTTRKFRQLHCRCARRQNDGEILAVPVF